MFEYDTVIALESTIDKEDCIEIEYPASCVVYLRGTGKESRKKVLRLKFPDGSTHDYKPEIIEVAAYDLDEMFDKKLRLMIPFYLIRYESALKKNDPDDTELQKLLEETRKISNCLNRQAQGEGKFEFDVNLMGLTKKIADYLCRTADKNKERIGEIMGGKVLELESDRLRAEGRMEGRMEGHAEGCAEVYSRFIIKGMISYEDASRESGLSIEDLKKAVEATMNS